jgi:hypothetical protein
MSIDSVSIGYSLVYQASATFAQPLTLRWQAGGMVFVLLQNVAGTSRVMQFPTLEQ